MPFGHFYFLPCSASPDFRKNYPFIIYFYLSPSQGLTTLTKQIIVMKTSISLSSTVLALVFIVSCGGNESPDPSFKVDNTNILKYNLNYFHYYAGQVSDFTPVRYDFYITDGEYHLDEDGFATHYTSGPKNFGFDIYLYSNSGAFIGETFDLWDRFDCETNSYSGLDADIYWQGGANYDYASFAGTVKIYLTSNNTWEFDFDGEMYNMKDCTELARIDGSCPVNCTKVPIKGVLKKQFTVIEGWNYGD
jgi:hypothetical protein